MATEKRLVDANTVYEMGHRTPFHIGIADLCDLKELLEDVPTVDAAEVVHGRWEDVFKGNCAWERYKCSVCGGYALYRHEQVFDEWKTVQVLANYCPNCGAKMDGDGNGT